MVPRTVVTTKEQAMAQQPARTHTTPDTVNPSVDEATEGVTTMDTMFAPAVTVDEVVEVPLQQQQDNVGWTVIRPGLDIEDMTVGDPTVHYSFKAGQRYKVPFRVAEILYHRDYLMEVPQPL
jgi:hypothetical protein